MRLWVHALVVSTVVVTGCSARRYTVTDRSSHPFRSFGAASVEEFGVRDLDRLAPDRQEWALRVAGLISGYLRERIQDRGIFRGGGRGLVIRGAVVDFDNAAEAHRKLFGFAAGEDHLVAEVTFVDETGGTVARIRCAGAVTGGWHPNRGPNTRGGARRVAKAVVDFVEANYESIAH